MSSLNKYERCQLIMRYLHKASKIEEHTYTSIAKALDLPYVSVRKTIKNDFPESFCPDFITGGWTLTGIYPGDREFDLEPAKDPNDAKKVKATHYDSGQNRIKSFVSEAGLRALSKIEQGAKPDDNWYAVYNTVRALEIFLKVKASPNPQSKLLSLVEKPEQSQSVQAWLAELTKE